MEEMQRRRDAESIERSQSRAQVLKEREEKEVPVVEDSDALNSLRDKFTGRGDSLMQILVVMPVSINQYFKSSVPRNSSCRF